MPRYIDPEHADAEVRCFLCDNPIKSDNGCDGGCHYNEDLFNKIMEIIGRLSTIEVEPVRHGRWIDGKRRGIMENQYWNSCCSECFYEIYGKDTPYCPNCGAKMDGGDKNAIS